MRRRPITVQRRGPGLLGTVARTAVITGTASATSRAMNNAADSKAQQQMTAAQSQSDLEQMKAQMAAMQAQQFQQYQQQSQASMQAQAPATDNPSILDQLQQLSQLKQANMLSDAEFQAAKAKLLGT